MALSLNSNCQLHYSGSIFVQVLSCLVVFQPPKSSTSVCFLRACLLQLGRWQLQEYSQLSHAFVIAYIIVKIRLIITQTILIQNIQQYTSDSTVYSSKTTPGSQPHPQSPALQPLRSPTPNSRMEINHNSNITPIQLKYWSIRGAASPIRMLLEIVDLPYKQQKYQCPRKYFSKDHDQTKKKCFMPSLPYISHDGLYVNEVIPICKYIAKIANRRDLLGKTIEDEARLDEILCKFTEHRGWICKIVQADISENLEVRTKQMKDVYKEFESRGGDFLQVIRRVYKKNQWYLGYFSLADLFIYDMVFYMTGLFANETKDFEELYSFQKRFEALPRIKSYLESPRVTLKLFFDPKKRDLIWQGDDRYF